MTNLPQVSKIPPTIPQAALAAWIDVRDVIGTITNLAIVGFLISVVGDVLQTMLASSEGSRHSVVSMLVGLIQAFLLTPYLIAVHRLIVINDNTDRYRLAPGEPRFQRFFGWSLFLSLAILTAILATALLPLSDSGRLAAMAFLVSVVIVVALRLFILFPAIAVDAPGATLINAWADTKGRAGTIFLIGLVASVPLVVAGLISYALVWALVGERTGTTLEGAVTGMLDFLMVTLFVAIAARLYLRFGCRLNGVVD